MTDKKLLELAAKAAKFEIDARASFMTWRENNLIALLNSSGGHSLWNPLTDDGDALRLAVKLNIVVDTYSLCVCYHSDDLEIEEHYPQGVINDMHAATRRAIVRAAAKIGAHK